MATVDGIITKVERVERRYNADREVIPGGPDVTWADNEILDMVRTLAQAVDQLQAQVKELQERR